MGSPQPSSQQPKPELPSLLPRRATITRKNALVRAEAALDSAEVGELLQGASIDVLERRASSARGDRDSDAGGRDRARVRGGDDVAGWISSKMFRCEPALSVTVEHSSGLAMG